MHNTTQSGLTRPAVSTGQSDELTQTRAPQALTRRSGTPQRRHTTDHPASEHQRPQPRVQRLWRSTTEIVVRLQSSALGGTCFGDAPPVERQVAVETWLDLESDPEAILDTADAGFCEGQSRASDAMNTGSDREGDEQ